jgi:hypothetical protein
MTAPLCREILKSTLVYWDNVEKMPLLQRFGTGLGGLKEHAMNTQGTVKEQATRRRQSYFLIR